MLVLTFLALLPMAVAATRPRRLLTLGPVVLIWILAAGQIATVVTMGLVANDSGGFYPSWRDLIGQKVTFSAPAVLTPGSLERSALKVLALAPHGHGAQLHVMLIDPSSPVRVDALVYLPAAYEGSNRLLEFPVIEVVGAPATGPTERLFVASFDREIAADRMPPAVVLLVPSAASRIGQTLSTRHNADALLGTDLRRQVGGLLRIRLDPQAWALMGIGSGSVITEWLNETRPPLYSAVLNLGVRSQLAATLDDIGVRLSPPLAPALMGAAQVTSQRENLRG